jgi:hypothetical protein
MKPKKIIRQVQFEQTDWEILKQYAQDNGLGGKWISSATRQIIREYDRTKKEDCKDSRPTG